jgi:uncharacterized protein
VSVYQLEASSLVKRYVDEAGSDWLRALLVPDPATVISIADLTRAEIASALARRTREGALTTAERDLLIRALQGHCARDYRVVPTDRGIIDAAVELVQEHPLRAADAVQLATALTVNASLVAQGLPALTFVVADDRLIAAAQAEGLVVENPNQHP